MTGGEVAVAPGGSTLAELYEARTGKASDKWTSYIAAYERLFAEFRNQPIRLFEIGVQNGGSLEIWSRYFPLATHLVGCDIDPECGKLGFVDPRIRVVVGDASDVATAREVIALSPSFDLVIDDGSHRSGDICRAFGHFFPLLDDGGMYVVEDLHCSYWIDFEGGLSHPLSSIAFFKRLADITNHEHWGVPHARADVLADFCNDYGFQLDEASLSRIHSVEIMNSMCVVRTRPAAENVLGPRVVAGLEEAVAKGHLELRESAAPRCPQPHNRWAATKPPSDDSASAARLDEMLTLRANELEAASLAAAESRVREDVLTHRIGECDDELSGLRLELTDLARAVRQAQEAAGIGERSLQQRTKDLKASIGERDRALAAATGLADVVARLRSDLDALREVEGSLREGQRRSDARIVALEEALAKTIGRRIRAAIHRARSRPGAGSAT